MSLPPIPKIIHVTWKRIFDFRRSSNRMLKEGLQQLAGKNPDWEVRMSDDKDMLAYLQDRLPAADYALVRATHPAEQSDLWRLLKMCYEGGLYMDVDRLANQPIAAFVHGNTTRMALPTYRGSPMLRSPFSAEPLVYNVAQDVMCSAPGNPVFCRTAAENVKRRAECALAQRKASLACGVLDLGPRLYMDMATQVMLGEGLPENVAETRTRLEHALASLEPLVTTYADHPPFDTILYHNHERNGSRQRSWLRDTYEALLTIWYDRERKNFRDSFHTIHWTLS